MESYWIFLTILPVVAFLYAAVGHGGASGYLALMSLFSISPEVMRPTALILNLFVAGISFYHFYKGKHFDVKLFFVFAISSIPMSFMGGRIEVDTQVYKWILGVLLIFAILKMFSFPNSDLEVKNEVKLGPGLLIGGVIGFLSGLIGIGGGIILSPVILLLKWGRMKEAAAVSALFIWVNSGAGLIGQLSIGVEFSKQTWLFVGLALIGGYFGGLVGSRKMNNRNLRYLLGVVLLLASIKLLLLA